MKINSVFFLSFHQNTIHRALHSGSRFLIFLITQKKTKIKSEKEKHTNVTHIRYTVLNGFVFLIYFFFSFIPEPTIDLKTYPHSEKKNRIEMCAQLQIEKWKNWENKKQFFLAKKPWNLFIWHFRSTITTTSHRIIQYYRMFLIIIVWKMEKMDSGKRIIQVALRSEQQACIVY